MFRAIALLCLLAVPFLGACSNLSSDISRETLICGPLPDGRGQYLTVVDPDGRQLHADEIQIFSLDSRLQLTETPISSKGCIQIQHKDRLLVKAIGKPWVAKIDRSEGELTLAPALEQSLAADCVNERRVNSKVSIESLLDTRGVCNQSNIAQKHFLRSPSLNRKCPIKGPDRFATHLLSHVISRRKSPHPTRDFGLSGIVR